MKKYLLILLTIASVGFAGCGEEVEPLPPGTIEDTGGLTIELEWTSGGSTSDAYRAADLELEILKDGESIQRSAGTSFESVSLSGFFADADYDVQVEAYRVTEAVTFTLFVKGNDSNNVLEYTGRFNAGDTGSSFPDFVTISKEDNTYTVQR